MSYTRLMAMAVAATALLPVTSQADPTTGACEPTSVKFIASEPLTFISASDAYSDLPQARVAFRQGGRKASCVLVRFSANANGAQSDLLFRALLDGTEALPVELIATDGADIGSATRRFTFVFPSVMPGRHTLTMQHRRFNGTTATIKAHNTIVWFAP